MRLAITGNTAIPSDSTPAEYLRTFGELQKLYRDNRKGFAKLQLNSMRLSRVLKHKLTAAEYLRQWSAHLDERIDVTSETGVSFDVREEGDEFVITIKSLQGEENNPKIHWGKTKDGDKIWHDAATEASMQFKEKIRDKYLYVQVLRIPKNFGYDSIEFVVKHGREHRSTDSNGRKNYRIDLRPRPKTSENISYQVFKDGDNYVIEIAVRSLDQPILHWGKVYKSRFDSDWEDEQDDRMKQDDVEKNLWTKRIIAPVGAADVKFALHYTSTIDRCDNNDKKDYTIGFPEPFPTKEERLKKFFKRFFDSVASVDSKKMALFKIKEEIRYKIWDIIKQIKILTQPDILVNMESMRRITLAA